MRWLAYNYFTEIGIACNTLQPNHRDGFRHVKTKSNNQTLTIGCVHWLHPKGECHFSFSMTCLSSIYQCYNVLNTIMLLLFGYDFTIYYIFSKLEIILVQSMFSHLL